jgi:hypothetical protein
MTLRQLILNAWIWLTAPVSPYPIAIFRILIGLILLLNGLFLYPDIHIWFSNEGIFGIDLARSMIGSDRLNVFLLGDSPRAVSLVFWVYMAASASLMAGISASKMALVVFICLASFAHRNIYILHSGDTFLRLASFLLIFSPSGAALSVESYLRETPPRPIPGIGYRLLQFQVCLVYFAAFLFKAKGAPWIDGSAVYIVQQLTEFARFPLPDFMRSAEASKILTWSTLAIEGLFPLLVWFRDTRIPVIVALIALHLGIEYSMNIQLFEWTLIASTALFLTEGEIRRMLWPQKPSVA